MKPKFDITFLMESDPRHKSKRSEMIVRETEGLEAVTEFYVKQGVNIESIKPRAFGTTLDLVWPSPENIPDTIEPVTR